MRCNVKKTKNQNQQKEMKIVRKRPYRIKKKRKKVFE